MGILLINVKMPTNVDIFNIYQQDKYNIWVLKQEKSYSSAFLLLWAVEISWCSVELSMNIFYNLEAWSLIRNSQIILKNLYHQQKNRDGPYKSKHIYFFWPQKRKCMHSFKLKCPRIAHFWSILYHCCRPTSHEWASLFEWSRKVKKQKSDQIKIKELHQMTINGDNSLA